MVLRFPSKERLEATIALLAEHGIDANWVVADTWNAEGYEEWRQNPRTSRPSKVIDPITHQAQRIRRTWPAGFPVERLIEIRGGEGQ